jgi:hypothetical protein
LLNFSFFFFLLIFYFPTAGARQFSMASENCSNLKGDWICLSGLPGQRWRIAIFTEH